MAVHSEWTNLEKHHVIVSSWIFQDFFSAEKSDKVGE